MFWLLILIILLICFPFMRAVVGGFILGLLALFVFVVIVAAIHH